jgi:hypothetical protein
MDFPPWTCKSNPKHGDYTSANCPKCAAKAKREENRKARAKLKTYRVWIDQINQTYIDVKATNTVDAQDKACRKWRREEAFPNVSDTQELE